MTGTRTKSGTTMKRIRRNSCSLLLKPAFRRFLKKPFGTLCQQKTALAAARKARFAVSVGDATTLLFLTHSIRPSVAVADFLEKRFPTSKSQREKILSSNWGEVFVASNPAGTISPGALLAVKEAVSFSKTRKLSSLVVIEGEEDLLFLAAVLHAPLGALLFYGQPGKGIVMLEATRESKKRVEKLLGEGFD